MDNNLYKNKYRTQSTRLASWDYRSNAAYFITMCSRNKQPLFGSVIDGKMQLSSIGVLADVCWYEIKNHHHHVSLGEFVVMPNHVHGVLLLDNPVETLHATSLPTSDNRMSDISPKKGSVSSIIRSYKSAVTRHAHRLGFEFAWQPRFYDHIIRNERSLTQIHDYILTNPQKWADDRFFIQ